MIQKEFIDRYNALTGVFLRKFGEADRNQNIVFSPFSILSLLSILADATSGSTQREVQDLLYGGGWHHKDFADQLKAVREELTRKEDYSDWLDYEDPYFGKPILDREDHLCTANAVFVREDYKDTIRSSFRKLLVDAYDGGLFSSPDLQEALGKWSREATREMLPRPRWFSVVLSRRKKRSM